jgi:hypothetical protein
MIMQCNSFFARCPAARHVFHVTQGSLRVAFAEAAGATESAANGSKVAIRLGQPMTGVGRLHRTVAGCDRAKRTSRTLRIAHGRAVDHVH